MSKVSVSEESIAALLSVVQEARSGLETSVIELKRAYFQAGEGWNDKKYHQLGEIVERASRSILLIGCHLSTAKEKLKKMQQAIENYISTGEAVTGNNSSAYTRAKQQTKQETTRMTIGGKEALVFDHPNQLANQLYSSQGNNTYGMDGTCSLVSTANMLTISGRFTTEQEIVDYARNNGLCSRSGGTDTRFNKLQQIWSHYGQSSTISFDGTSEQLAQIVESGHGVVLGVDADILWGYGSQNIDACMNHAVTVTSVARDPDTNEVRGFFICDSGRCSSLDGSRFVDMTMMNNAHFNIEGRGFIYTNNVIW